MKTVDESVLEKAIKALEDFAYRGRCDNWSEALIALDAVLEQPDQEPGAYKITGKLGDICHFKSSSVRKGDMVYTIPPRVEKEQEPLAINCKVKRDNNGICPHHNLHCGWPDCNKPQQEQDPMPRWKIDELMRDAGWQNSTIRQADLDKVEKVVRAVEQALKKKNHV